MPSCPRPQAPLGNPRSKLAGCATRDGAFNVVGPPFSPSGRRVLIPMCPNKQVEVAPAIGGFQSRSRQAPRHQGRTRFGQVISGAGESTRRLGSAKSSIQARSQSRFERGRVSGVVLRSHYRWGRSPHTFRIVVVVPAQSAEPRVRESALARPVETVVIDRQPLFLAALSTLLGAEPLSARVTTCSSTDAALEIARNREVDVVFCEIRSKPMSGSEFVRLMAEELPAVPVILLGDRDDEALLTEALTSSAAGLFTKDASLDEFLVGVQAVLSGHRAIGASLMGQVLDRLAHQPMAEPRRWGSQLSPTEVEILVMIGRAESIPAIAASRGISHKTVRNHLAKIYRKLELHGRTEAMLWAARTGLTSR